MRALSYYWKNYSLSITLAILFLVSWVIQTFAGWIYFSSEQTEHGQTPEVFGESGYVWSWLQATMENWQSEFLQLFTFVVLTAYLIHKNSHESKDSNDRLETKIDRISKALKVK